MRFENHIRSSTLCPICRTRSKRHSIDIRILSTLEGKLIIQFGKFYCPSCRVHFNDECLDAFAPKGARYGWDVIEEVYRLRDGHATYREIHEYFKRLEIHMPASTAHDIIRMRV